MSSSTQTQCHAIFMTRETCEGWRGGGRFKKSARYTRGINEVLTVGSPPLLTPMGVLL